MKPFFLFNHKKQTKTIDDIIFLKMHCKITITCMCLWLFLVQPSLPLSIEKSVYKDIVIEIKDNVPVEECMAILNDLEVSLKKHYQKKIITKI